MLFLKISLSLPSLHLMSLESTIKALIRDVPDFPKPGIVFKDITPILENQETCNRIVEGLMNGLQMKPDAIVGIESRGFLFGFLLANKLNIPFVLIRKAGKLPYKTIQCEYALEYGTAVVEMHEDSLKKGWNVLVHDDLLATGGTAEAAARLIQAQGANVSGFCFIVELEFLNGKQKLIKHSNNITCLAQY
ncbi:MAG: adenine phosphoribosyltransferase [Bacteroidota bacterium]|jgi:adenine phosphoribosyltransferase|nr:adenine phosphoribosyltransferase [Bacteroidota bacterium]